ncbi:unnamed protein product [Ostreobium quekettii]|uniref:CCT domain-containing protein n=1 Tax=Ostreobium quekettii TaxID=121088 RepID=A0A8S1IRY8_9CHLO|nr:unnamed protein product [Ostreobium quekettii]|eukprot:evm.model.scf_380EXC.8 EVM.evm.TU.scf_380EXC.8   scf_380EXC:86104-90065(-)
MAHVCPPRAVETGVGGWPARVGHPQQPGGAARPCELCRSADASVFQRASGAHLCAMCEYSAGMMAPAGGRHTAVAVADGRLAGRKGPEGGGELVKVEVLSEACGEGTACGCGGASGSSSASEGTMLKCTADDALLDALNDPAVLELFPASLEGGMDGFQDVDLDSDWIETLELEGTRCGGVPATGAHKEPDQEGQVRPGQQSTPGISVQNVVQMQQQQQQQALACQYGAFPGGPIPNAPHCPMPMVLFLPMGPWDNMAAAGFNPFMPPSSMAPLHPSQNLLDRKARVARYREKRKHRSFENKIRYTSRKLYAENRPRIKGRFARPDELEAYLKEKRESGAKCEEDEGEEEQQLLTDC